MLLICHDLLTSYQVPNAPCGVEIKLREKRKDNRHAVPNAPCGVEIATKWRPSDMVSGVPNAPCGVEIKWFLQFLI